MPGRPKVMAKNITELAEKAEEVFNLILEYIPKQYEMREGPFRRADLLCQLWKEAEWKITDAMYATSTLAKILRDKAGIPESEAEIALRAELAEIRGKGRSALREIVQAASSDEQGTNGDTELMGSIDIPS